MDPRTDTARRARFESWVERFGSELYDVSLRRVGGRRALAEELLHEIYLVAWRKLETFQGDDDGARRWLHKIGWNLTPAVWRRNPNLIELSPDMLQRHRAAGHDDEGADPEDLSRLRHCMGELEPIDQTILEMRFGLRPDPEAPEVTAELSWAEVATMMVRQQGGRFQPDQGRMRANRALQKLRQCMQRQACTDEPQAGTGREVGR